MGIYDFLGDKHMDQRVLTLLLRLAGSRLTICCVETAEVPRAAIMCRKSQEAVTGAGKPMHASLTSRVVR